MKILLTIALICLLPGCTFNVAWRGTLTTVDQKAETDGRTANSPVAGATSIAAEKTTDFAPTIPTGL